MGEIVWSVDPASGGAVMQTKADQPDFESIRKNIEARFDEYEPGQYERLWGNQIVVTPEPEKLSVSDVARFLDEAVKSMEAERMATERENENVAWLRLMDALEDIREAIREDEHIRGPINTYPNNDVLAMQQRLEETEFWAHKANARRGATVEEMEKARDQIELEDAGVPDKPDKPSGAGGGQADVVASGRQAGKTAAQRAAAAVAANAGMNVMHVAPIAGNGMAHLGIERTRERRMTT